MTYALTKEEKETTVLYNQTQEPVCISTYDPDLRRRLANFSKQYPDLCKRTDKQCYPDYVEYEIEKSRVSIRLVPPYSEEWRRAASIRAKQGGLGTQEKNSLKNEMGG